VPLFLESRGSEWAIVRLRSSPSRECEGAVEKDFQLYGRITATCGDAKRQCMADAAL